MPGSNASQSRRPSAIASFVLRKKDPMEISLEGSPDSFINTYTTLDRINGTAHIKFEKPTDFDRVIIHFEGVTNTFVEKVASTAPTTGRAIAKHVFMRVPQPIDETKLPENKIFQAGETYTVPFAFIVPERLLDNICTHRTATNTSTIDSIKEEHLQLPPSFGDQMVAGDGQTLLDDMAPEMSKVSYYIKVQVVKTRPNNPEKRIELASKTRKLRIIPAKEEKPPLTVSEDSEDYLLRKEKDVKKGSFKLGKTGKMVAEAAQPRALVLPPPNERSEAPVATSTTVNLRFDPANSTTCPPILGAMSTKLKVLTYFATNAFRDIPRKSTIEAWATNRGSYSETVDISTRPISAVQWTRHEPTGSEDESGPSNDRRGSKPDNNMPLAPTTSHQHDLPFYTASILLPISLPHSTSPSNKKTFTPTFHSCLISRFYVLDVNMTYHLPSTAVSKPSIQIKLPIQVASRGNPDARPNISQEEMASIQARMLAMQEQEVADEFWRPRRLTFVEDGVQGDPLASPEYTELDDPSFGSRQPSVSGPASPEQRRQSSGTGSGRQERGQSQFQGPPGYADFASEAVGPRVVQFTTMPFPNGPPFPAVSRHRPTSYGFGESPAVVYTN